jgi:hypothetical protein
LNKCINESDDHPLHVSKIVVKFDWEHSSQSNLTSVFIKW